MVDNKRWLWSSWSQFYAWTTLLHPIEMRWMNTMEQNDGRIPIHSYGYKHRQMEMSAHVPHDWLNHFFLFKKKCPRKEFRLDIFLHWSSSMEVWLPNCHSYRYILIHSNQSAERSSLNESIKLNKEKKWIVNSQTNIKKELVIEMNREVTHWARTNQSVTSLG